MKKNKTLQRQLTIRFGSILFGVILMLNILILGATSLQLYESSKRETEAIADALSQVTTQTNQEWKNTLQLYIAADDPRYFIRVSLPDGSTVYSSDAYQLYDHFSALQQVAFLSEVLWQEDTPYYLKQFKVDSTNVAIMTSMEDNFEVLVTLARWSLAISGAVLILGTLFIFSFAKRTSAPLVRMNREIGKLSPDLEENEQLSEPNSPQEARQIAISFNRLLARQKEMIEREHQFIADASHEMKTPLAAIRGHVNLIKRRSQEHPEVIPTSIAFIDKESKRMETLTQQLLMLNRERALNQPATSVKLADIIEAVLEELGPRINQTLEQHIDPEAAVEGQQEHFYQIIKNLIENAIKYTPVYGRISIALSETKDQVQIEVANTGVSIPDKEKKRIFERFYRIDQSRSSEVPGSGIGLSIVKQLTELYRGTIRVTDLQPDGVCFTVKIPR